MRIRDQVRNNKIVAIKILLIIIIIFYHRSRAAPPVDSLAILVVGCLGAAKADFLGETQHPLWSEIQDFSGKPGMKNSDSRKRCGSFERLRPSNLPAVDCSLSKARRRGAWNSESAAPVRGSKVTGEFGRENLNSRSLIRVIKPKPNSKLKKKKKWMNEPKGQGNE